MGEMSDCPKCGWQVEVIAVEDVDSDTRVLFGEEPGKWTRNGRELRMEGKVWLHHNCSHPQVGGSQIERDREWWACQEPDRRLDENVRFDLNCRACGLRSVEERSS